MLAETIKRIFNSFQTFLMIWAVVILVNQIFIFGACFEIYCLLAALPHTSVIAAVVVYFLGDDDHKNNEQPPRIEAEAAKNNQHIYGKSKAENAVSDRNEMRETSGTYGNEKSANPKSKAICPKCGATMKIRMATKGAYSGKQFLGCSTFPQCKGIVSLE